MLLSTPPSTLNVKPPAFGNAGLSRGGSKGPPGGSWCRPRESPGNRSPHRKAERGFQGGLRASDGPQRGLGKAQTARAEGQDERGKAAGGLQPMETGAGFGPGRRRRKRWKGSTGKQFLRRPESPVWACPAWDGERGGRASSIAQEGPWVAWKGGPSLPPPNPLAERTAASAAGLGVERRTRYG